MTQRERRRRLSSEWFGLVVGEQNLPITSHVEVISIMGALTRIIDVHRMPNRLLLVADVGGLKEERSLLFAFLPVLSVLLVDALLNGAPMDAEVISGDEGLIV